MDIDFCETITINDKVFFWRNVTKKIDDIEEHHYRVAEKKLENFIPFNLDFFENAYESPIYFVPLDILMEKDGIVVDWCENNGMYFD